MLYKRQEVSPHPVGVVMPFVDALAPGVASFVEKLSTGT